MTEPKTTTIRTEVEIRDTFILINEFRDGVPNDVSTIITFNKGTKITIEPIKEMYKITMGTVYLYTHYYKNCIEDDDDWVTLTYVNNLNTTLDKY